ncbi:type IV pilin [Pseudoxanthomonas sangjuensis]|uniref:PilW family protein n=1 Tax=Pseudoxanthomonas sangjuensis TaxID=1503750 RepID=UPI0013916D53|nr:prepilin-type N-terminal cleavage/methylation domain-containing protein [Pseudoxanthomonas sangjuensis]KAF1706533.1 hypothetical protein CSC71_14125 [Pseudoxanthomonas sangjuensis]
MRRLKQPAFARRQAGLSLIELMIAMVAGLIVIGSALAFTVSTVRAYGENIRSTRLSQELRTGMNLVVRELRRAGYDSAAVTRVMTSDPPSGFINLSIPASGGCIFYEYDRNVGGMGDAPTASEKRGIRYSGGAVQMNTSDADSNCGGSNWTDLTDPRVVNIVDFKPALYESPFCTVIASRDADGNKVYDTVRGSVRVVSLCLKGGLASDPSVVRQLTDSVRIRAEDLSYATYSTKAAADAICAAIAAPTAAPSPSELNDECAAP